MSACCVYSSKIIKENAPGPYVKLDINTISAFCKAWIRLELFDSLSVVKTYVKQHVKTGSNQLSYRTKPTIFALNQW